MPYLLPDDNVVGNCRIRFSIPDDPKWTAVIVGAIAQLAVASNWEDGTGILTPEQAAETALEIRESVVFTGC